MKNCKTKKMLFISMTTLLSSLILFGCNNSGSSPQNGVVENPGSSIDFAEVARYGEPITAFTSDGRYMFSIGNVIGHGSVIYLTAVNPHAGAVSTPILSLPIKNIVAMTLVKDKYLFAISSNGYIREFVLSGTSSGNPQLKKIPGIDNTKYTPSPSAMTSSSSVESNDGFLFIVDFNKQYVQIGSVDNKGVLTLNHEPDKMGITGAGPNSITVLKNGKAAYVTNSQDNSISELYVDVAHLKLSPMPQKFASCPAQDGRCGGSNPSNIELSPNGQYAYVADYGGNYINIYNLDSSNGYLSYQGYIGTGNNPSSIHIAQNGFYAYVYNSDGYNGFKSPSISQYAISDNGSTLTPIGTPITQSNLSSAPLMTTDNKGHFYGYNSVGGSVEIYSGTQAGTISLGDECDYRTFSYVVQGQTTFEEVPACASYMTQIALGGGGGPGGDSYSPGSYNNGKGGKGGIGGLGFARDVPITGSGVQLSAFVGGGGGGGQKGKKNANAIIASGGAGYSGPYGSPSGSGAQGAINGTSHVGGGGGGGGGASYFMMSPNSNVTLYAGGGGGGWGSGGGIGTGDEIDTDPNAMGAIGGASGGWGGTANVNDNNYSYGGGSGYGGEYESVNGGNGIASTFSPNSTRFPSSIENRAGQGLLMVMFTTKPLVNENYWIPGGSWLKTCVPGPRFYTPANTTFETAPAGAIDYVCSMGQNGGNMQWMTGTLQMSDTATNPFYNNKHGTVVPN